MPAGSDYNSDRVSEPVWRRSAVGGTKLCPFGFSGTRSGTGFGSGFGSGGFLQPDKSMANVNTNDTTNDLLVWLISGRDCSSKGYSGQPYNRRFRAKGDTCWNIADTPITHSSFRLM